MFTGPNTIGIKNETFDSIEESKVAENLRALVDEGILKNFFVHPTTILIKGDFLIQFGSMASLQSDVSLKHNSMCFLEYDGLGEKRTTDLSVKMDRYDKLSAIGIESRWLMGSSYEEVKDCILHYKRPNLVLKNLCCESCARERTIHVLTKSPDSNLKIDGGLEICRACQKNENTL